MKRNWLNIRILADGNVDYRIVKALRNEGVEVIALVDECPGITDFEVIEKAKELNAALLTEDADFGRLVFAYGKKINGVIYLRYPSVEYLKIAEVLRKFLKENWNNINGKFVVLTPKKIRIRRM